MCTVGGRQIGAAAVENSTEMPQAFLYLHSSLEFNLKSKILCKKLLCYIRQHVERRPTKKKDVGTLSHSKTQFTGDLLKGSFSHHLVQNSYLSPQFFSTSSFGFLRGIFTTDYAFIYLVTFLSVFTITKRLH